MKKKKKEEKKPNASHVRLPSSSDSQRRLLICRRCLSFAATAYASFPSRTIGLVVVVNGKWATLTPQVDYS